MTVGFYLFKEATVSLTSVRRLCLLNDASFTAHRISIHKPSDGWNKLGSSFCYHKPYAAIVLIKMKQNLFTGSSHSQKEFNVPARTGAAA